MSCLMKEHSIGVRRQTNLGEYDRDGFSAKPKYQDFGNRDANVQPITGRERLILPETQRLKDSVMIFTEFELCENDIIKWKEREYEVALVEYWDQACIPHFEAMAVIRDTSNES